MEPDAAVELFNRAPTPGVKFQFTQVMMTPQQRHTYVKKVAYNVEKFSDIIHMKRSLTTRVYNLSQNAKFDNCSPLSQKVINHLVKCFSYAIAQNKGDSKGIQAALKCHCLRKCSRGWKCGSADFDETRSRSWPYWDIPKAKLVLFSDF